MRLPAVSRGPSPRVARSWGSRCAGPPPATPSRCRPRWAAHGSFRIHASLGGDMNWFKLAAVAALAVGASAASAQTVKIGFITSYSGLNGNLGPYMERAVRLYLKQHEKELGGVKVELITRDDTGPNPDKARQLAQELVVRDKVNLIAGVIFTPNAMAMAPVVTEAKVPFIIMNAGTSVITTRSPYMVRTSFTLWQSSYPLGQW